MNRGCNGCAPHKSMQPVSRISLNALVNPLPRPPSYRAIRQTMSAPNGRRDLPVTQRIRYSRRRSGPRYGKSAVRRCASLRIARRQSRTNTFMR